MNGIQFLGLLAMAGIVWWVWHFERAATRDEAAADHRDAMAPPTPSRDLREVVFDARAEGVYDDWQDERSDVYARVSAARTMWSDVA